MNLKFLAATASLRTANVLGAIYWVAAITVAITALLHPTHEMRLLCLSLNVGALPLVLIFNGAARRISIETAQQSALLDDLTSLPGRKLFLDRLARALLNQGNRPHLVAVLFLDLDRFKLVNDTLGHPVGDQILQSVAARLQASLDSGDMLARFGGDEFTVLLDGLKNEIAARMTAERLMDVLNKPVIVDGLEVFTGASIGVALSTRPPLSAQELIRRADIAVYQAKDRGGGRVVFYQPTLAAPVGRLSLEGELRSAIERGEICVFYQPEVDLRTNRIVGFEALVRWRHRQFGLLLPDEFVKISEEIGMIAKLGRWVLWESCSQMQNWRALYKAADELTISINLSSLEFRQDNLLQQVERTLSETGLDGKSLKIEITETTLMDDFERAASLLKDLRERGVHIAIDDFGTGYSSLTYLKRLPMDTIKIDQSFVRDADDRSGSIVKSIISLAHSLGTDVTAEGIETAAQYEWLAAAGCDRGQGYYFSKPLEAATIDTLLAKGWLERLEAPLPGRAA